MKSNLDSSWKYTTKVNISTIELTAREVAYRQGVSDFQNKLIEELEKQEDVIDTIELIKNLKK